jgi:hopanoid biosynthesis associated protein HpnK
MVTGDAVEEAVAIARSRPALAVGLHLVLVRGRAALPAREIPAIVDEKGNFPSSPISAGLRYQFRRRARADVRREIRAQLERFGETSLALSHVDGHLHLHMHPVVLGILSDLAAEFAIPAVRLPSENLFATLALDRSALLTKIVWSLVFRPLRRLGERRMRTAGVIFADRVYGLLETGRITEEYLLGLLPRISAERVEVYAHPAVALGGEPLSGPPGSGAAELEALVSPRVKSAASLHGFRLTTYAGMRENLAP